MGEIFSTFSTLIFEVLFLDVFGDGVDPTDAESGAQTRMQQDAN